MRKRRLRFREEGISSEDDSGSALVEDSSGVMRTILAILSAP